MSNVLLGISGGIASYKACDLTRLLIKNGCSVRVVMTESAKKFITPLTMSILSQNPVQSSLFDYDKEAKPPHIELAQWAEKIILYPLSAHTISKMVIGAADNLILSILLASKCMVYGFPSMNDVMWNNIQVQKNVEQLREQKRMKIYNPIEGDLACRSVGIGHTIEPQGVIDKLEDDDKVSRKGLD